MKVSYMFIAIAMICFTLLYIVNGEKVEEIRPRGGKGRRGGRVNGREWHNVGELEWQKGA